MLELWRAGADTASFVLGMVTAFCECVDGECKRLAFSPPVYSATLAAALRPLVEQIVAEHGLLCCLEENADLPPESRPVFWAIAKYPDVLEQYRVLRAAGENPCRGLEPFYGVLSYGTAFAGEGAPAFGRLRGQTSGCAFSHALMQGEGKGHE